MPVVEPKKSTFPITHFGPDERSHSVPQVQQFPPTPGTVIGDAPRTPTFQERTMNSGSPDNRVCELEAMFYKCLVIAAFNHELS